MVSLRTGNDFPVVLVILQQQANPTMANTTLKLSPCIRLLRDLDVRAAERTRDALGAFVITYIMGIGGSVAARFILPGTDIGGGELSLFVLMIYFSMLLSSGMFLGIATFIAYFRLIDRGKIDSLSHRWKQKETGRIDQSQ